MITGLVDERAPEHRNQSISTGEVEVVATQIEAINTADPLPFQIDDDDEAIKGGYEA